MHWNCFPAFLRFVLTIGMLAPGCAVVNGNFHTVKDGEFYRSGQLGPHELDRVLRKYEIQTVVSFRGTHPEEEWYREELAVCDERGVTHHDFKWSKSRLPEPEPLADYLRLCREAPKPMLVHCQGGTHRAGVGSACFVLIEGGSVDEAREQFGIFFDDAPIGRLVDLYEGSPLSFEEWVVTKYPAIYEAEKQREEASAQAEAED